MSASGRHSVPLLVHLMGTDTQQLIDFIHTAVPPPSFCSDCMITTVVLLQYCSFAVYVLSVCFEEYVCFVC